MFIEISAYEFCRLEDFNFKGHFTDETEGLCPFQAISLVEKVEPAQVRFTLLKVQKTNGVSKCKMDVKSTWISTWHQMDHVSWSLGGRPTTTQNRVTMALRNLTTVDSFYSIKWEDDA